MKKEERMYIDLHIIQTVPPSCVNRDDTGSPKTAVYGGIQRARVSSQSWKRAMREMFATTMQEDELGVRTKKIVKMVADAIKSIDSSVVDEQTIKLAETAINLCGVKTKDGEAQALFFLSIKQAHNLAQLILTNAGASKKEAQRAIQKDHAIDIALFGRMVADDPTLNADASAQVAHSISTHRVDNEYDYFTAVDEMSPKDNAGAGMIGVVEFNSATLYRYATVAVHELHNELDRDREVTAKAVKEFVRAFVTSMPTGKQNTFANRTLPDAVLVTLRNDQPINFVGAFEKAVKISANGYVDDSIKQLDTYANKIYSTFARTPVKAWSIGMRNNDLQVNFDAILKAVENEIILELNPEKQG